MSENNNWKWESTWQDTGSSFFINGNPTVTFNNDDDEVLVQHEDYLFQALENGLTASQEVNMMHAVSDFFQSQSRDQEISTTCPTPVPIQDRSPPTGSLICNTDYSGIYNFFVDFEVQPEKQPKGVNWTYSSKMNKLYVLKNTACPVQMGTRVPPPPGSTIRAILIFNKVEHLQTAVKRCVTHRPDEPAGVHLMISDMKDARDGFDPVSQRDSILVPFSPPEKGMDRATYIYKYLCLGSCVGGPNRRSMQMIFTLEDPFGEVIGRKVVNIRICACPGRDRKNEEAQVEHSNGTTAEVPTKTDQEIRSLKRTVSGEFTMMGPVTKKRLGGAPGKYNISVDLDNKEDYEALKKVVETMVQAFKLRGNISTTTALPKKIQFPPKPKEPE